MEPILKFSISNQKIFRADDFHVVAKSKSYLHAEFSFLSDDWEGLTKTAIFDSGKPYTAVLEDNACLVPWEALTEPGIMTVSVFGGDLITTDKASVRVHESGYKEGETPKEPTPTVYEQIIALLESKADGISYSENILKLLSGEKELARVTITGGGGGGREIELQKSETAIQWRYIGDAGWTDLVQLVDITGPSGPAGKDGADGQPGENGITPTIGDNGNWYLGDTDTGKPSRGETGPAGADGRDGTDGAAGQPGTDGKSAYQYAVEGGYTGTEAEFAAKLAEEMPTALPNPNALTFTGAVTGSYDGSAPLSVAIPSGGGSGNVNHTFAVEVLASGTVTANSTDAVNTGVTLSTLKQYKLFLISVSCVSNTNLQNWYTKVGNTSIGRVNNFRAQTILYEFLNDTKTLMIAKNGTSGNHGVYLNYFGTTGAYGVINTAMFPDCVYDLSSLSGDTPVITYPTGISVDVNWSILGVTK